MSELLKIMSIDASNLAATQHEALKQHALAVILAVAQAIDREDYEAVFDKIEVSPSNEWGEVNHFINFDYGHAPDKQSLDILGIVERLMVLKQQKGGK